MLTTKFHTRRRRAAALIALVATLACAQPAAASPTQEMVLQDDPALLGVSNTDLHVRMFLMKQLGVDRIRVSLFWGNVAPRGKSQRRPAFPSPGAGWPGAYPKGAWDPYDRIVGAAATQGIKVLMSVTGPAPYWATPGRHSRKVEGVWKPNPKDFRDFVTAAGIRYGGGWPVNDDFAQTAAPTQTGGITIGPITIGGKPAAAQQPAPRIPRVDAWSIWNEPNYPQWLQPIWRRKPRPRTAAEMLPSAAHHYRRLVDAAFAGLAHSRHSDDLVLIGETSPRGAHVPTSLGNAIPPAEFARELYCLGPNFKPFRGKAARERRCPVTAAERRRFRARHSGLFRATGYAHHPYSLDLRRWRLPPWKPPNPDNVPMGNIGRLIRTLDRADFYWGNQREPKQLWLTEYGYQTTPPDPFAGVSLRRQGPLNAWGEYLAYRNPRIASIAQFLLRDDVPLPQYQASSRKAWVSWQSGLYYNDFRPKPYLAEFQRPIHIDKAGPGVRVFASLRPAADGAQLVAQVQFRRAGEGWNGVRTVTVTNMRGYLDERVRVPRRGFIRVLWRDPKTGGPAPSRQVKLG